MGSDAVGVGRMHERLDPESDQDDPVVPCNGYRGQGKHEHRKRRHREILRALEQRGRGAEIQNSIRALLSFLARDAHR